MILGMIFWLIDKVESGLGWLFPVYRASRFYADCRRFYVRGDHRWNHQVREVLLREYGYREDPLDYATAAERHGRH